MTDEYPVTYSIAWAEGPDGQVWLARNSVLDYLRSTASYVLTAQDLDESGRTIAANYLSAMADAFAAAGNVPVPDNEREE